MPILVYIFSWPKQKKFGEKDFGTSAMCVLIALILIQMYNCTYNEFRIYFYVPSKPVTYMWYPTQNTRKAKKKVLLHECRVLTVEVCKTQFNKDLIFYNRFEIYWCSTTSFIHVLSGRQSVVMHHESILHICHPHQNVSCSQSHTLQCRMVCV